MLFSKFGKLSIESVSDIELLLVNGLTLDNINTLAKTEYDINNIHLNIPNKYNFDNFKQLILSKLNEYDSIYKQRILTELLMFEYTNLQSIACIVWYITDYLKATDQVYGVGRGSSCSVYCFYILGLHKVDCVKYNICYSEFFKKELPSGH